MGDLAFGPFKLWRISEVERGDPAIDDGETLRGLAQWSREYLAQQHPAQGRLGPVCPWCPTSIAEDLFWLSSLRTESASADVVATSLRRLADLWHELAPRDGSLRQNKTFVIAVPDDDENGTKVLGLQRELKPFFLSKGLMLGEFFRRNAKTGVRSDQFQPLRSPVPLLVVRDIVSMDIVFLGGNEQGEQAYFKKFPAESGVVTRLLYSNGKKVADGYIEGLLGVVERRIDEFVAASADIDPRSGFLREAAFFEAARAKLGVERDARPLYGALRLHLRVGDRGLAVADDPDPWLRWKAVNLVRSWFREGDTIGVDDRGEFLALIPLKNSDSLTDVARRLRWSCDTTTLAGRDGVQHPLTIALRGYMEGARNPLERPLVWDGSMLNEANAIFAPEAMTPLTEFPFPG